MSLTDNRNVRNGIDACKCKTALNVFFLLLLLENGAYVCVVHCSVHKIHWKLDFETKLNCSFIVVDMKYSPYKHILSIQCFDLQHDHTVCWKYYRNAIRIYHFDLTMLPYNLKLAGKQAFSCIFWVLDPFFIVVVVVLLCDYFCFVVVFHCHCMCAFICVWINETTKPHLISSRETFNCDAHGFQPIERETRIENETHRLNQLSFFSRYASALLQHINFNYEQLKIPMLSSGAVQQTYNTK